LDPLIVGLCGGSCSGKTTLARALLDTLGTDATLLMFDDYYRDNGDLAPDARAKVNFDHPDSLDVELFCEHLEALAAGQGVDVPHYDFATHTRPGTTHRVESARYVFVDGILLLALGACRQLLDLAVFVDAPADVRLARRIERDVAERGREASDVRRQFAETVAPMHETFVGPSASYADVTLRHPFEVDAAARALLTTLESTPQN
jgi:uridine kinase